MAVRISKPALNLREELTALRGQSSYEEITFHFTGDGSLTDFTLERGFEPLHVYVAGAFKKQGSGDDYTVSYDGFLHTVVFAVAPADTTDIAIVAVREYY